jgi:predicted GNAT family acetyltransferase
MITLKEFVSEYYPNGFRADSIEMDRLMGKYAQYTGQILSKDKFNEQVHRILDDALQYKNQFFFISTEPLAVLIDHAIDSGYCLFFYTVFQQKHRSKLAEIRIHSPGLLKVILEECFPYVICKEQYFYVARKISTTENNKKHSSINSSNELVIRNELLRCFTNGNIVLNCTQFTEQTYIPLDEIKNFLNTNNDFIGQTQTGGYYTHLSLVDFGDEQQNGEIIRTIVNEQIGKQGFANTLSPEFLDGIKEITESNPELSQFVIREATYQKFLANDFLINGNNITSKEQGKLTNTDILRNYISGKDEVLFSELSDLCDKHLGKFRNYYAIRIGNEMMVRVNADKFVSEEKIKFDTTKIDETLTQFCPQDYVPLKAVKYFHSFPLVMSEETTYSWNLYLLEGYVRRFSKIFHFDFPGTPNNQNVGIVLRKDSVFTDYKQITNDAIIRAGIAKNDKNRIYDFLIKGGYICSRKGTWTI